MTQFGGKLVEIERRDIEETRVYYSAVREPIQLKVLMGDKIPEQPLTKKERWVCVSVPYSKDGFAVFVFDGME